MAALRPEEALFDVSSADFCAGCGPSGALMDSGSIATALGFAVTLALSDRGFGLLEASFGLPAVAATERLAVFPGLLALFGTGLALSEASVGELEVAAMRRPAVFLETGLIASFTGSGSGEALAAVFAMAAVRRLAVFLETGLSAFCTGSVSGETSAGASARIVVSPSADSAGTTSAATRAGSSPWEESAGVSTMAISGHSGKATVSGPELLAWRVREIGSSRGPSRVAASLCTSAVSISCQWP